MHRKKPKSKSACPPELFFIYEDAANIGATAFNLENLPHAIMASFSVRHKACEIDFEFEARQEMIRYLLRQPGVRESRRGQSVIEYREHSIPCLIEVEDARRGKERIRVSWQVSAPPEHV